MRRKDSEPERERYFQYTFYLLLRLMSVYAVHLIGVNFSSQTGTVEGWESRLNACNFSEDFV